MLNEKELNALKVEEIREVLKINGISYYKNGKRLTKAEMIKRYLESDVVEKEEKEDVKTKDNDAKGIKKVDSENHSGGEDVEQAAVKTQKDIEEEETFRRKRKMKYIERANVGVIVAFKVPDDERVISAMIKRKSTKRRKFKVETAYGAEFVIGYDDVIWVRTNKRWPKGVYNLFKKNKKMKVKGRAIIKDVKKVG